MKLILYIFLLTSLYSNSQTNFSLTVSIPKDFGYIGDYQVYTIQNSKLYSIRSLFNYNWLLPSEYKDSLQDIDTSQYIDDTLGVYKLNSSKLLEIEDLIKNTDSLGSHYASGCSLISGWPRFFISAEINQRKISGEIVNCYRKHIFNIIDLMNSLVPEVTILEYDKSKLILKEKECNEKNN